MLGAARCRGSASVGRAKVLAKIPTCIGMRLCIWVKERFGNAGGGQMSRVGQRRASKSFGKNSDLHRDEAKYLGKGAIWQCWGRPDVEGRPASGEQKFWQKFRLASG